MLGWCCLDSNHDLIERVARRRVILDAALCVLVQGLRSLLDSTIRELRGELLLELVLQHAHRRYEIAQCVRGDAYAIPSPRLGLVSLMFLELLHVSLVKIDDTISPSVVQLLSEPLLLDVTRKRLPVSWELLKIFMMIIYFSL